MTFRYQLRFLRYHERPWIVWDALRETSVFTLGKFDKTFAELIVDNLNGVDREAMWAQAEVA